MTDDFHPVLAVLATWPLPEMPWSTRCAQPASDSTGRVAVQIMVTDDEEIALAQMAEAIYKWDGTALFNAQSRFPDIAWDQLGYMWGYEPT